MPPQVRRQKRDLTSTPEIEDWPIKERADWERIKRHPQLGADIIGEHDDPLLKLARQIALTQTQSQNPVLNLAHAERTVLAALQPVKGRQQLAFLTRATAYGLLADFINAVRD